MMEKNCKTKTYANERRPAPRSMDKGYTAVFLSCFLAFLLFAATPLTISHVQNAPPISSEFNAGKTQPLLNPTSNYPPNAMWVDPSLVNIDFSAGHKFNVTVWVNLNESCSGWQIALRFNTAYLNALRAGGTNPAGSGSDFFSGHSAYALGPQIDNSAGVLYDMEVLGANVRSAGSGSLCWIEFQVVAMTTQTTLSLDEVDSYILDPSAFYDVQVTRYTATVRAPAHRTYTLDADFDEGTPIWIEHETVHDQLQLPKNVTALPFIWVPNNEGTVSKINTNTGKEIGRYWMSDGTDSSPSRTTVDLLGGCWIGCRQRGTVVKIGLFEAGQWIDRNLDGICQTSQDTNADGNITGSEILLWGQDECVLYEVVLVPLFEGVYVPGTYGGPYDYDYWGVSPRGLAIDASNNLWAGTFSTSKYYYVDGATGVIIRSVDVAPHNAYGAVIDEKGILWSAEGPSGNQPNVLLRFDPSTNATSSVDIGHTCYGLGLDYNHHLWVSSYWRGQLSRIDISADPPTFVTYNTPEQIESRGVAATSDNSIWVANTGADTVTRYDNSGNLLATITGLNGPTGVSVDANGKVWATDLYDEYLHRIDPASNTIDLSKQIIGSGGHYTYSDMTGIVLRTITTKIGTWTVVFDSTTENTPWGTISRNSSEPEGTSITVKVRSSNDTTNWSTWESAANGVRLSSTPDARYLQIETTFQITSGTVSPILYDLTVAARAAAHDIAITEVTPSKTVVGQGYSLNINVTAANQGDYTEIFNVTVYANTTSVATQTISLTSGNSTTITFPWNTTGFAKGNCTISAVADTVPGETHIADNTFADGWVIVAMVGDITGPDGWPDGDVDIRDVSAVARLFGVSSPSPEYNPNFDINDDGDIDIKDVSTVARHYGEHYP